MNKFYFILPVLGYCPSSCHIMSASCCPCISAIS